MRTGLIILAVLAFAAPLLSADAPPLLYQSNKKNYMPNKNEMGVIKEGKTVTPLFGSETNKSYSGATSLLVTCPSSKRYALKYDYGRTLDTYTMPAKFNVLFGELGSNNFSHVEADAGPFERILYFGPKCDTVYTSLLHKFDTFMNEYSITAKSKRKILDNFWPRQFVRRGTNLGIMDPCVSPDGKKIAFTFYNDKKKKSELYIFDIKDAGKKPPVMIAEAAESLDSNLVWAGEYILYKTFANTKMPNRRIILNAVNISSRETKAVFNYSPEGPNREWMPPSWSEKYNAKTDTLYLLDAANDMQGGFIYDLHAIEIGSWKSRKIADNVQRVYDVSNDGRHLAYAKHRELKPGRGGRISYCPTADNPVVIAFKELPDGREWTVEVPGVYAFQALGFLSE